MSQEINRTSESLHETTRSSSEPLALTQTVEVIESREVFVEEVERREITKPYTDRSLQRGELLDNFTYRLEHE